MLPNVGTSATLGWLLLLSLFNGLWMVPAGATPTPTTPTGRPVQGSLDHVATSDNIAFPQSLEQTNSREGPYIKVSLGNAGILIAFVGGTTYGVKGACTSYTGAYPAQVCVGSLVAASILDLVAASYLVDDRS